MQHGVPLVRGQVYLFRYLRQMAWMYGGYILLFLLLGLILRTLGVRSPSVDRIVFGPIWLLPILGGVVLCLLANRKVMSASSYFVWIVPMFLFCVSFFQWPSSSSADLWQTFFGPNCQASECLYEMFLTGPFFCSIAYSLTAFLWSFATRHAATIPTNSTGREVE